MNNQAKNKAAEKNQKGTAVPKSKPLTEKQQAAIDRRKDESSLAIARKAGAGSAC
jgi:hypothetical protein